MLVEQVYDEMKYEQGLSCGLQILCVVDLMEVSIYYPGYPVERSRNAPLNDTATSLWEAVGLRMPRWHVG